MKILFMCVANSARSQLAHGLAKRLLKDKAVIESAGSKPSQVNPVAIQVLTEVGIDISNHKSKSVDDLSPDFVSAIDYVITLCAEEVCPVVISKAKRIHWPLPDPASEADAEAKLLKFRETRDEIQKRFVAFCESELKMGR